MTHVDGESVPPDMWLTQLGHVKTKRSRAWSRFSYEFRCCPSATDDGYISLLGGKLSVEEVVPLIARGDTVGEADCVRHVLTSSLTDAGMRVFWRPLPKLDHHVAVYSGDEWDEEVSEKFDRCFNEYLRGW